MSTGKNNLEMSTGKNRHDTKIKQKDSNLSIIKKNSKKYLLKNDEEQERNETRIEKWDNFVFVKIGTRKYRKIYNNGNNF